MCVLPYSGKLSREKTFVNFAILCLSTKVFSMIRASNPLKFSLRHPIFPPACERFIPRKIPTIRFAVSICLLQVSKLCCEAIETLFDNDVVGEVSLEVS